MNAIYCKGDTTYHYASELPKSLRPYVDYQFSSGPVTGEDFNSFSRKFRNAVKALLPSGFELHQWSRNHYYCTAVVKTPDGAFLYVSIPDVRWSTNGWLTNILCRTMAHEKDWCGGPNHYASLFNLGEKLQYLWRMSKEAR